MNYVVPNPNNPHSPTSIGSLCGVRCCTFLIEPDVARLLPAQKHMHAIKSQTRSLSIEHEDYDGKPLVGFRSQVASIDSLTSHNPHTERHHAPYIRDSEEGETTDTMVSHSEALHVNTQHHLPPPFQLRV
ncbi:hypothetical protein PAXRUDRAFT_564843 [Paxillus rubicundulus Ve08.2h10]|uniref:Uncharacterized protein n=1 Tax=Paxillus rubicundulus Ve08.2h10 TaxID=930991 RepID=A0A0D0E4D3_9AGAM|nr:hypothetical protein PAXRUDRAFT_564843 [Paxillus rubicundulus Ve08.2h10]